MNTLIVSLPPRARPGDVPPGAAEAAYALTPDGQALSRSGQAGIAALPPSDAVVVVVPATELSWHRITVPRAPAGRLRAALGGLLEDALLEDDAQLHFALAPDAKPGLPAWVAAVHGPWLTARVAELEQAGRRVERIVPALWPSEAPAGHFFPGPGEDGPASAAWLALADDQGVACLRLDSSLARARQAAWVARPTRWTALAQTTAAAERWLGGPVQVASEAESLLRAARSAWNLRQFELAPRHRGTLLLLDALQRLRAPQWRPLRWGAVALLAVQVLGVNLWAWQQRLGLQRQQAQLVELLRTSHPQVRAVLDAPAQMRRETDLLRAASGRSAATDLEPLLALAARSWPDGQGPAQSLRYETGRLQLSTAGWSAQQLAQFRERVQHAGGTTETADGQLFLTRGADRPGR